MKSYVCLTFAFMGWGYYEMSGGADFEPEQRVLAATTSAEPEIVTRAETTTLLSVSSSIVTPQPEMSDAEITQAVVPAVTLDTMEAASKVVEVAAPVVEPKLDIRVVAGSRVNTRMDPSTDYDVITTLEGGTKLEVLGLALKAGWPNVY